MSQNPNTITIGATKAVPHPPSINDGVHHSNTEKGDHDLTTDVRAGNIVIFQKEGDIGDLINIQNGGETNIFSTGPTKQPNGTWRGVIGPFSRYAIENYGISYTVDSQPYYQDPKIAINP